MVTVARASFFDRERQERECEGEVVDRGELLSSQYILSKKFMCFSGFSPNAVQYGAVGALRIIKSHQRVSPIVPSAAKPGTTREH